MTENAAERRTSGQLTTLPASYTGSGRRRSTAGAAVPHLFDPRTGFFTLPVLLEFVHYDLDGFAQTLTNERFVTPLCVAAIGVDALDAAEGERRERLLELVGGEIHRATRAADRMARDDAEFVALLRHTLAPNVRDYYVPRVRELVAGAGEQSGLTTTLSFGIASLTEHLIRSPEDMVAKARRALAEARSKGPGYAVVYNLRTMPL